MNWAVFIIVLLVADVLDNSFVQVFAVGNVWPAIVPCLVTFIAMHAPRHTALWAALIAGALVDLTSPSLAFFDGPRAYALIGPSVLGFVFGTSMVIPLRT